MRARSLTVAVCFCVCAALAQSAVLAQKYKAQVVGISDGDTIKVMHDGQAKTLRLAQIDW